ncbi:MAG: hydrolase TatD [Desulfurococcales archaeon ex4484_58]|nr:MAG: hydrolase TatD [Desulfurococcales archaeon ex4484_58]
MKLLYADAHCHSNPVKGMGAEEIAKRFRRYNGWFIALVSLPPYHYGFEETGVESYVKTIELMINEADKMKRQGIETIVFIGFHPAEVDEYVKRGLSLKEIIDLAEKVFNIITQYIRKGLVHGIGEVGRQHYSTSPERIVTSEIILMKALEAAKDYDAPVHLHLEQGGWVTVESINKIIDKINIRKDRIFLHHSNYDVGFWSEKYGFWYTIPAKERDLKKTLVEKRKLVLVESDFIDDPRRPGVSSYPWDIALRINKLLEHGVLDRDYIYEVMVDHVVEAYGLEYPRV